MPIETDATVPRLRHIAEALVLYHNVIDACMVPDSPLLAGKAEAQDVIRNLESWHKTDKDERGNPPHIVAGIRLEIDIHVDLEVVLDALPELAKRWERPFKELFSNIGKIIDDWKSGRDDYETSLGKAFYTALQAKTLAERVVVKADTQEPANEPDGGSAAERSTARRSQTRTDTATTDTEEREATALDDLVTLDQAAAVVGRSKRSLELYLQRGDLPRPDLPGGGGKANRWYWGTLRPALQKHFRPDLPRKFPASRVI